MLDRFVELGRRIRRESARVRKPRGDVAFYAGHQILRYYDFLGVIVEHYLAEERAYKQASEARQRLLEVLGLGPVVNNSPLSDVTAREIAHHIGIQFWIESFFLFAKILLDKMALFIRYYYGEPRGLKLGSHDKLEKNFKKLCDGLNLTTNPDFLLQMKRMKTEIPDFRDNWIAHDDSPRTLRGTTIDGPHQGLSIGCVFPTESDLHVRASDPISLGSNIDIYLGLFMDFISENGPLSRDAKDRGQA